MRQARPNWLINFPQAQTPEKKQEIAAFPFVDMTLDTGYASRPTRIPGGLWGVRILQQDSSNPVTALLVRWRDGDRQALDALMPLVYTELRRLAHYYLQRERGDHTLQSTALVHEAYLRLAGNEPPQWQNRAHFFGIAAHLMRQILVEYARGHSAAKRGGGAYRLTLDEAIDLPLKVGVDVVALDKALNELSELDEQQGRIVELRFFGGLTIEDTSEILGLSPATVKRDWVTARAWLHRAISGEASP
jgi:RNA polymerase sigma factor (TIGR02999 family)